MNVPVNTVIAQGPYSGLPAIGSNCLIYFATDVDQAWYNTGAEWVNVTPAQTATGEANLVFATPSGAAGEASLRALVPADLPVATGAAFGAVKPDGSSITIAAGVLSAIGTGGSAQSTVAGSVSGSAVFSQPFGGAFFKKVIVLLEALSGTATYAFPTAFAEMPDYFIGISAEGATLTALSTTEVTISGAPSTGAIVLEGF